MPSASSGGSSPADGGAAAVSDPGATVPVAPRIVEPLVAEALRGEKSLECWVWFIEYIALSRGVNGLPLPCTIADLASTVDEEFREFRVAHRDEPCISNFLVFLIGTSIDLS